MTENPDSPNKTDQIEESPELSDIDSIPKQNQDLNNNSIKKFQQRKQQLKQKTSEWRHKHPKLSINFDFYLSHPIQRYIALVEKELRVLIKDRGAMVIMFAIPLVVLLILTVGLSGDIISTDAEGATGGLESTLSGGEIPKIGIIDLDDSPGFPDRDLSQELMQKFIEKEELGQIDLYVSQNQTDLERLLGIGQISSFIIIPDLFEFNLSMHIPVIVPFVIDSLNLLGLLDAQEIVEEIVSSYKEENGFTGVFKAEKIDVNLPEKAQLLYASAFILFPLVFYGIGNLTSTQTIVADIPKDRMVLTPTNKKEIMAAKVTALQILMSGLIIVFMIGCYGAGLKMRGSPFAFFLVLSIITLNAIVIGVAISAIATTPLSAFQYFIFLFIFQAIVLIFVEDPAILSLMPVHNGSKLVMNVLLRGQSFYSCKDNIFNLFMESVIVYLASYWVFKKQKTML